MRDFRRTDNKKLLVILNVDFIKLYGVVAIADIQPLVFMVMEDCI